MNVMTLIVLLIILIFMFNGYRKGFVKVFGSMVFFVAVAVLVYIINPYVCEFLKENTPLYRAVQDKCEEALADKVAEEVKAAVDTNQISDQIADQFGEQVPTDEWNDVIAEALGGTGEADDAVQGALGLLDQKQLIEELNVPEILKKNLISNNNEEGYRLLDVSNFTEYLSAYAAGTIVNIVSYVVTVILVILIVKSAIMLLDAAAHLPVIGGANRTLGLAVGFVQGVLMVWFAFLVITIMSQSDVGKQLIAMISESPILSFLYNYNIFLKYLL